MSLGKALTDKENMKIRSASTMKVVAVSFKIMIQYALASRRHETNVVAVIVDQAAVPSHVSKITLRSVVMLTQAAA